jgi:hypothetical protein
LSSLTAEKSYTSYTPTPSDGNAVESKPLNPEAEKTSSYTASYTRSYTDAGDSKESGLATEGARVQDVQDKTGGTGTHIPVPAGGTEFSFDWDVEQDEVYPDEESDL